MKKYLPSFLLFFLFINCTSQKNSEEFIQAASGRYLFNANEVLEIYFEDGIMHAKWRGNDDLELLKINDSAFYMKAINEKMLFVSQPEMHIKLAPKQEHEGIAYTFKKMKTNEKTAYEYFNEKEYSNALIAFKNIQEKDSLNPSVQRFRLNRFGYDLIRKKKYDEALEIFKINSVLYPNNSNVYDSMGEAYALKKDTIKALEYFNKALSINPENRSSKAYVKKLTKK